MTCSASAFLPLSLFLPSRLPSPPHLLLPPCLRTVALGCPQSLWLLLQNPWSLWLLPLQRWLLTRMGLVSEALSCGFHGFCFPGCSSVRPPPALCCWPHPCWQGQEPSFTPHRAPSLWCNELISFMVLHLESQYFWSHLHLAPVSPCVPHSFCPHSTQLMLVLQDSLGF